MRSARWWWFVANAMVLAVSFGVVARPQTGTGAPNCGAPFQGADSNGCPSDFTMGVIPASGTIPIGFGVQVNAVICAGKNGQACQIGQPPPAWNAKCSSGCMTEGCKDINNVPVNCNGTGASYSIGGGGGLSVNPGFGGSYGTFDISCTVNWPPTYGYNMSYFQPTTHSTPITVAKPNFSKIQPQTIAESVPYGSGDQVVFDIYTSAGMAGGLMTTVLYGEVNTDMQTGINGLSSQQTGAIDQRFYVSQGKIYDLLQITNVTPAQQAEWDAADSGTVIITFQRNNIVGVTDCCGNIDVCQLGGGVIQFQTDGPGHYTIATQ